MAPTNLAQTSDRGISPTTNKPLSRIYYYHEKPVGSYQITQRKANRRIIEFRPDNIVDENHQLYELIYDFLPDIKIVDGTFIIEIGLKDNPYPILNAICWVVSRCGDLVHQVQRLQKEVDRLRGQIEEMRKTENDNILQ